MSWKPFIKFWFKDCGPDQWFFKKKKSFDVLLRRKFLKLYWEVVRGETGVGPRRKAGARRREAGPRNSRAREYAWEHADWRKSPKGRLAEIIIIDQLSRNMFRGTPGMFAHDTLGLALAQEAVRVGSDKNMGRWEKNFFYLPYMHSESKKIQKESMRLFRSLKDKQTTWFANDHKKIVDTFGRYPHRNKILGRKSTTAEKKFMRTHKGY